jgi:hypothetical protein
MEHEHGLTLDELGDEITTLAAHIHSAMCRWLRLVAEFDAREGWAAWGCKSCAHWISWRCSIAPGAAREHVRVARRLGALPLVAEAFARGELSYSKVRALTRVDDVEKEQELLGVARSCTAAQLERAVRGYQRVVRVQAARAHEERFLTLMHDDDGSILIRGRLPRDEGAIVLKALESARERRASRGEDVSAETLSIAARNADALIDVADTALGSDAAAGARSGGDRYQVVVHVDADALTGKEGTGRCELDDGAPLSTETARRVCCDASVVALVERAGRPLSVGRKTRSIPPALRRALRSRDGGCRFPGCTARRRVDAHHIEHWAHGGATALANLVELCRHHHRLVHEGGYRIERARGKLIFRSPDGRTLRPVPRPRRGDHHHLTDAHRRRGLHITAETPVPDWYGDPLNLPNAVDALLDFAPPQEE